MSMGLMMQRARINHQLSSVIVTDLPCSGVDGSTDFPDTTGRIWTPSGGAQIQDNALYLTSGQYLTGVFGANELLMGDSFEITLDVKMDGTLAFFAGTSWSTLPIVFGADGGHGNPLDANGRFPYFGFESSGWRIVRSATALPLSTWVSLRAKKLGKVFSIAMDGAVIASGTIATTYMTTTAKTQLYIGRRWDNYSPTWSDKVSIRNFQMSRL